MQSVELVNKIAQALYNKTWPAYKWETQDDSTKYAWLDQAEQLVKTLESGGLIIVHAGKQTADDNSIKVDKDV